MASHPRRKIRQRAPVTLGLLLSVLSADCAQSQPSAAVPTGRGTNTTFDGAVPIGHGRSIYLHCQGTRGPTVVLISGYHDGSALWMETEAVAPAVGPSVLQGLAKTTRVCAYDRPRTLDYSTNPPTITTRSTPEPMPRTAADVVSELHATLAAAHVPGPYILVGHSMGGLFSLLYARTFSSQVAGLVLVDAFSPNIPKLFGAGWPADRRLLAHPGTAEDNKPGFEVIDIDRSVAELAAAAPLRKGLPLAVLSKTEPFALPQNVKGVSSAKVQRIWDKTQDQLVALEPNTPHIATGSDHYVQVRQPDTVIAAIRLVIGRAVAQSGAA
jgi:pimeloyl-ACP methyl ester carboxylesterase